MPDRELKKRQVAELYRRLESAPPAASHEEAFDLIGRYIKEIGDELTSDPYDPAKWREHDRIYPPQFDREVPCEITGARAFVTVAQRVVIGVNGAMLMMSRRTLEIEFRKPGLDGKGIDL